MKRYKSLTPISDFSITAKVRTILLEGGHSDLIVEQITDAVHDLEQKAGEQGRAIKLLEDAQRERLTETDVHKIFNAVSTAKAWDSTKVGLGLVKAAALLGVGAVITKWVSK